MPVERVEGFGGEADGMRACDEIDGAEHALAEHGIVVVEFRLAVGRDEPLRRFKAREEAAFKRFEITAEDRRSRETWDAHDAAVRDVVDRPSTATGGVGPRARQAGCTASRPRCACSVLPSSDASA